MQSRDRLISLYKNLISTPSVIGSEGPIAEFLADHLESAGIRAEVHRWGDQGRPNLIARVRGSSPGPRLLFLGHLDTVPVQAGWKTDPFTPVEDGDRVYGLGACDMKGGLAAMVEAAVTAVEQGKPISGELILAFTSDEEGASLGTYQAIEAGLLAADMAVVGECRFDPIILGFRGRYTLDITVHGKTAHASRYPEKGENAIISAARLAEALEAIEPLEHPEMGRGSGCVRHIEGGTRLTLQVPDSCRIFYERYVVPGETNEMVLAQVRKAAERLGLSEKVEIKFTERKSPFLEGFATSRDSRVVTVLAEAFKEVCGRPPRFGYDPSVCDANYLANLLGIPVVTFGPSGGDFHAPNEFGLKSEVIKAADIYGLVIDRILVSRF